MDEKTVKGMSTGSWGRLESSVQVAVEAAFVEGGYDTDEGTVNRHVLQALADSGFTDLYAALERAAIMAEAIAGEASFGPAAARDILDAARAALAKARGE